MEGNGRKYICLGVILIIITSLTKESYSSSFLIKNSPSTNEQKSLSINNDESIVGKILGSDEVDINNNISNNNTNFNKTDFIHNNDIDIKSIIDHDDQIAAESRYRGKVKYISLLNKQKELEEPQNLHNSTPQLTTQSSRLLNSNSTIVRNKNTKTSEISKSEQLNKTNDDQYDKSGRSFNIDKYTSPDFHNINNVYSQDISPDVARYANAEFFDTDEVYPAESKPKSKSKSTITYYTPHLLTTPSTKLFDNRYRQIQNEIKTNINTLSKHVDEDPFRTSTERYRKVLVAPPKNINTTINFENVLTVEHTDSEVASSKHINTVLENNTHLNIQTNYLQTVKYDQKLLEPIQTLDIITTTTVSPKDNELDYFKTTKNIVKPRISTSRPRIRTRISLKTNKIIPNQNKSSLTDDELSSELSSEKNIIIKKPTVKWKPYYLSTQTPTSLDPIFDSFEDIQKLNSTDTNNTDNKSKRGSLTYTNIVNSTVGSPADDDSIVQENRFHLVQIQAPNTTETSIETTTTEPTTSFTTVSRSESQFETTTYEEDVTTTEPSSIDTTTAQQELPTTTERLSTTLSSLPETTTEILSTTEITTHNSPEYTTKIFELTTEALKTTTDLIPTMTSTENSSEEIQTSTNTMMTTDRPTVETTTQMAATSTIANSIFISTPSISTERVSTTTLLNERLMESTTMPSSTTETVENTTFITNVSDTSANLITTTQTVDANSNETVTLPVDEITTTVIPIIPTTITKFKLPIVNGIDNTTEKSVTIDQPPLIQTLNENREVNSTVLTTPINNIDKQIDNSIKSEKSNFLSNSNEDSDIKTTGSVNLSNHFTNFPPISISTTTTTLNYKHIDFDNTQLTHDTNQINRTPKFEKLPKVTLPNLPSTIANTTTKYILHKINENSIFKQHSTSTVEVNNNLPGVPIDEQSRSTVVSTISTTSVANNLSTETTREPDEYERSSVTIIAIVIISIAAICLVLLAILLIIMRKRQKRFNYGQRCTPVSLDAYSLDSVSVYNSVRRKGQIRASKRSYGNPAFEDTENTSHPLNFANLTNFANNEDEIAKEYENIPIITVQTTEIPPGCESKNRYANIIPTPETRVYLTKIEGDPHSDYINANFVRGPKNIRAYYIATQAPLENTIDDFWRMIWEQQSKLILMLTDLFENGVEKCFDYLPPSEVLDCHRQFGDFQITLKKREVKEKYIIHTIQLKNLVSNCWREITHMWYLGWPERGTPTEVDSMIAFLIEARSYTKNHNNETGGGDCSSRDDPNTKESTNGFIKNGDPTSSGGSTHPIVVHCSPGTGRTGTVIACDILMKEFELTRIVDVPKIVYRIRRDRANSVHTKNQYAYVYKVINTYATKLAGGTLDSI